MIILQWRFPSSSSKQLTCLDNSMGFLHNISTISSATCSSFSASSSICPTLSLSAPAASSTNVSSSTSSSSHLHLQQQQQQPPPAFPPQMPPHLGPTPLPGGRYDSAPPPVPPPLDPELRKRIDKLVEYVAKNGPGFEAMVCEREHKNPEYSFLFGGEGHAYYHYKLFLFTRSPAPFGAPFPPMPSMHPPPMNPTAASGPMMGPPQMHQPPFPHYDQQQPYSQPYMGDGRQDYEQLPKPFKGLSGPLPLDIAMELNNVIISLTGTKESIKGAKAWFMRRSTFAAALQKH